MPDFKKKSEPVLWAHEKWGGDHDIVKKGKNNVERGNRETSVFCHRTDQK